MNLSSIHNIDINLFKVNHKYIFSKQNKALNNKNV